MILFDSDWDKYPDANIATLTKNDSWLRFAWFLRDKLKVKNWAWCLALHDMELNGVDPLSPDLTRMQKMRIQREVAVNPWYSLREIVRIPEKGSPNSVHLRIDRGTAMFWWLFFNHIETTNLQMRQTGKSIKLRALVVILVALYCFNTSIRVITQRASTRKKEITETKELMDLIPEYLYGRTNKDKNNLEEITCVTRNNIVNYSIGNNDAHAAAKAGIGFSPPILLADEVAETDNIDEMLSAAAGGLGAAIQSAKKTGTPYGIGYFCTAGSLDTKSGRFYSTLVNNATRFNEAFYDAKDVV